MSETSLNTGEMLFQLRVWDYLAWALDDKRLDHVENLYYKGRPISVSTFANPNVPMVKCFDKAELSAGDIDSEYPFVIQADGMFDADVMDEREWIASQPAYTSLSVWDKFETLLPAKPSMECVDSGTRMFIRFTLGELAGMLNSGLVSGNALRLTDKGRHIVQLLQDRKAFRSQSTADNPHYGAYWDAYYADQSTYPYKPTLEIICERNCDET